MSSSTSHGRVKSARINNSSTESSTDSGILNERVLILVFESIKWEIRAVCQVASVCRKLRALAKRLLWRELCLYWAPRMIATLTDGAPRSRRLDGEWQALAKLLFLCCGCASTPHFNLSESSAAHFAKESRFSKTSGKSFLIKKCRGDLLYVSDPCEHVVRDKDDDLGIYRGVFKGFMKSRTRACLIRKQVKFEERVRCPYCGARVWSMSTAGLIPKSASRRLGADQDGGLEYFVCVNGHLHGACWLVPLSSDEEGKDLGEDDDDDDDEEDDDDVEDDGSLDGDSQDNGFDDDKQVLVNGSVNWVGNGLTL
ncbi:hypothetical protein M9H77_01547 [Catharanthus roseus]|uniref:Uncharacterized protein n=1 Tax=Catharanthus roseus TaxID=4058 RepID=A0ACC0C611_CATRO|nr:hypothetical protein M9H77_01547 [Catharanthus roseus]